MLPKHVLYYGKDEAIPAPTALRAGPLTLLYDQGDLRRIRLGKIEILRRVYVAVRDRNWGTVAPVFSNVSMHVERETFEITYDVANCQGEIDFTWQASIRGEADGTITFSMDGEARSTFWRNRIGFCILHPADLSGQVGVVEHVDGEQERALFPVDFAADQPVRPFAEMRAISHAVTPGVWAEVRFAGDIFEMEDQRNWTDASYKTFSTPLRLPFPVKIEKGTRISQRVQVRLRERQGHAIARDARAEETSLLTVESGEQPLPIPHFGLGAASRAQTLGQPPGQPLGDNTLERLRGLNLHHLRVDVQPGGGDMRETLEQGTRQAQALGIGLEVALHVPGEAARAMEGLRQVVDALRPPVNAWLCYPEKETFDGRSPVRQVVEAARAALESYDLSIPFCAGTDADFIFMKRSLPPLDLIEQVTLALCPQVHAFDNVSLVETLPMQGEAVRNARRIGQDRPVRISPVTLKMRANPYATAPASAPGPGELPPQVDARQMSLFGAGWTLGSLKYLAEAGAASVTFFETSGWRGVMEDPQGSPLPEVFRSLPDGVFPLYHVLADFGEYAGGSLLPVTCNQPLQVSGLYLRRGSAERMLLANHTAEARNIRVTNLNGAYRRRVLDETNALEAMRRPEFFRSDEFRAQAEELLETWDGELVIALNPFAVVTLDGLGE